MKRDNHKKNKSKKKKKITETVDGYLSRLPDDQRSALSFIRATVKKHVPDVTEKISYGMPTFFLGRALLGYAAFKAHCSLFPWSDSTTKKFATELSRYSTSAGTIRFFAEKPLPASLIRKIVTSRIAENAQRDKKSDR